MSTTAANVVIGPGAKPFELFFCEAFLDPGDGVLVFSPYFPTYLPNILRRAAPGLVWPPFARSMTSGLTWPTSSDS